MKILACLLLIWFAPVITGTSFAQENLAGAEECIHHCFQKIMDSSTDQQKKLENQSLLLQIRKTLAMDSSFYYPFSKVQTLGILSSPDSLFRICHWNLPLRDGTHMYFGFIQMNPESFGNVVYELTDLSGQLTEPEDKTLQQGDWFGCLYYDIVPVYRGEGNYYTLLGSDMNNLFSSRKVIETLSFDSPHAPVFGLPVIHTGKMVKKRMVFEFADRAKMSLTYHPDRQMIIFDHLSPPDPSLTGLYQFYGPDFSYDGLDLSGGKWVLQEDIDVRNR